jgi:hypothetical protein
MGTEGPPELTEFLTDREFWQQLGWTREYRLSRPRRQTEDYALIISLIHREEQVRANRRR